MAPATGEICASGRGTLTLAGPGRLGGDWGATGGRLGGRLGVFTPTHRIDDERGERQVGLAKRNPTLAAREARVARDVGLRFAGPTYRNLPIFIRIRCVSRTTRVNGP